MTNVTLVTTLRVNLSNTTWKKWLIVKAEIGAGKSISSEKALEKLIDDFNKNKGRQII